MFHSLDKKKQKRNKSVSHLNRVDRSAQDLLQHRQIVAMHGGHLSFFKHGTEATRSACDLQGLRSGDGVHLFLSLFIHAGLHQGVKYYSPDAPGRGGNVRRFKYEATKRTILNPIIYQYWKKSVKVSKCT